MPRKLRKNLIGNYFHIMVQGLNKEYIFKNNVDKDKYKNLLKEYIKIYKIDIIAYCIMNNHAHILIKVDKINEISKFMHIVNTKYAIYYNSKNKRVGFVFRNRYNIQEIKEEEHLKNCIVYINKNPVKANIVNKIENYKYSGYNEYFGKANLISKEELRKIFYTKNDKDLYCVINKLHNKNIKYKFIEIKEEVDYNIIINLYKLQNIKEEETIKKLKEEYFISERNIAKLLNISRYRVRKILEK